MDKKETAMKIWDASKAKFYSEMMNWCANLLGLEDATESELHEASSKVTETFEQIRESATKAATDAVSAQLADFTSKIEANTKSIADLTNQVNAKQGEVDTLTSRVTDLESSLKGKETELDELRAAHTKEKQTLSSEISKLKGGRISEQEVVTETVTSALGNGGGSKAGLVIENQAMNDWLGKASASKN